MMQLLTAADSYPECHAVLIQIAALVDCTGDLPGVHVVSNEDEP
jgi:hypothetical protein